MLFLLIILLPFSQSCIPTVAPDYPDIEEVTTLASVETITNPATTNTISSSIASTSISTSTAPTSTTSSSTTSTSSSTTSTSTTSSATTASSTASTTTTAPTTSTSSSTTSTSTTSSPTTTSSTTSTTTTTPTTSTSTTSTSTTSSSTTSTTSTTTTTTPTCISGYTLEADGNCYRFSTDGGSEAVTEAACQSDASNIHLVTIRNQQQNDIVTSLIGPTVTIWLGIMQIQPVATCGGSPMTCFEYIDDNSTPITYYNPNASQVLSDSTTCMTLDGSDGTWYSSPCDLGAGVGLSYVCSYTP